MSGQIADQASRFSERVQRLLERVEHRVAKTAAEKEAVYRLRYEAYFRNSLIESVDNAQLYDRKYDEAPNTWITTTFIDGELAATTRMTVGADDDAILPSRAVFSDIIGPQLKAGRVIVDFTRAAARLEASRQHSELPYVALRPGYMALEHFDADLGIATVRAEHAAFYRRVFNFSLMCEPRDYPGVTPKIACLGMDFRAVQDRIEARYPFFRSSAAEREALFGPSLALELRRLRSTRLNGVETLSDAGSAQPPSKSIKREAAAPLHRRDRPHQGLIASISI